MSSVAGGALAERGRRASPGHDGAAGHATNPGSLPGSCRADGRAAPHTAAGRFEMAVEGIRRNEG
jgi:hypothetical protein